MGGVGVRYAVVAAAAGIAAIAAFGLAAPAPGATGADASLSPLPGLDAVTYGRVAAYSARIENTGNVTLKNVTLHNPTPSTVVGGQPQPATFESASCAGTATAAEFSCVAAARLGPGESVAVTVAWTTPAGGSSTGCATTPCLVNSAFWRSGTRTLTMDPAETELLSSDDPSRAATYTSEVCTDPSSPTVATDPDVSVSNPLATSVCAPSLPAGTACDASPFVFSPLATFTFVVANASLPAGETIDTVYHDGVPVSTARNADPRVVRIKNEKFKGITTIVVLSSTNGRWTFG